MNRFAGACGSPNTLSSPRGFPGNASLARVWSGANVVFWGHPSESAAFNYDLASGDAIIGDFRLDEGAALCAALGLDRPASEPALVLHAYHRWGEDVVDRLAGDFAFAIWDSRKRALFCARDRFGIKPFFYRSQGDGFWFANWSQDLSLGTRRKVDTFHVLEFITGSSPTGKETFYNEIERLKAGRCGWSAAGVFPQRRYYAPSPASHEGEPEEAFRSLFIEAVLTRIGGRKDVGVMLSGGLDSSSITVIAARAFQESQRGPLPTFSRVFDETPQWNERRFIQMVAEREAIAPRFIASNWVDPFSELDDILTEQDGPFLAPGLALSREMYRRAADDGVAILLDGHGGDEVVSHGWGRLADLAHQNRIWSLIREARGVADTYGDPALPIILGALLHNPTLRPALRGYLRAKRLLGRERSISPSWSQFLNVDAVEKSRFTERRSASPQDGHSGRVGEAATHRAIVDDDLQPFGLEVLGRNAAVFGLEPRYPFWDRRLVEFCLGLDSRQKLAEGWTRRILRVSMTGLLPPDIQWRRDKLDFSPHLVHGMLRHGRDHFHHLFSNADAPIRQFVNLSEVNKAYRRLLEQEETAASIDLQVVWRTAVLSRWLELTLDEVVSH